MKRSEMILKMQKFYSIRHVMLESKHITLEQFATELLDYQESLGMLPPRVSEEDVQAIMSVYYGGYSTHQWDENLEKDEKVMEAKKSRAEAKARRQSRTTKNG